MFQLNAVKHVKIGSKRRGDKNLPVEFISDHGTYSMNANKVRITGEKLFGHIAYHKLGAYMHICKEQSLSS